MFRRQFLIGAGAALVGAGITAGCGGSPTSPGGVAPPPQPNPQPSPPPPPPTPASLGITRILTFGDSMTAGTTSPPVTFRALDAGLAQSYPFKLQTLLTAQYSTQTVSVFNAGIAGRRATQDRSRLSSAIADSSPDLVVLLEGANDLNSIVGPAVNAAIDDTVAAMEDMVRDTVARGLPVFLATLPPQRPDGPKAGGVEYLDKYNNDLKTMASTKGAIVIEVNAQLPLSLIGQDGLHPTELGYQTLAEIMFEAIKTRYEIATVTPSTESR
jgi:lysophospholipase L1-like esterase